jgi:hypothetical protein
MNADNTTIEVYQYDVSYMRDSVKSLSFPESIDGKTVTSIGKRFMDDADYDCVGIESISIPKTITNIADSAFSSDLCKDLKYVYYEGTEAEWNAVTIGNDNAALTNATVYFNGEQPTPTVTDTPTTNPTVTDTPTTNPTVTDTPTPEPTVIQEVQLYSLNDSHAQYLSIPDNYNTEYQIDIDSLGFSTTGTPSYRILGTYEASNVLGYSVSSSTDYSTICIKVSETGLVTIGTVDVYWLSSSTSSFIPVDDYIRIEKRPYTGNALVEVSVGSEKRYVFFYHNDYASTYIEEEKTKFLSGKNPQNAYEVADLGAQFAAQYVYRVDASYAELMIIKGGGDCWASADMVVKVANMYNVNAWVRNGRKDAYAGTMHANAMVEDIENGVWYEVEAG